MSAPKPRPSSASMSAEPSPTSSGSTKPSAALPPPRRPRIGATRPSASSRACAAWVRSRTSVRSSTARRSAPTRCLERKGARIGVITTRGFRDVLEMRRRDRPRTWGLWGDFTPIADRDMRIEVDERVLADGTMRASVDPDAGAGKRRGRCSPRARRRSRSSSSTPTPTPPTSASPAAARASRLAECACLRPRPKSCPKFANSSAARPPRSTPICNLSSALTSKSSSDALESRAFRPDSSISCSPTAASCRPRRRAGCRCVRRSRVPPPASSPPPRSRARRAIADVITADLGGTSFDVSLIAGGASTLAAQTTIDFGLVIRTPMIEITTIGAGGGSIAHVDKGGLLQVGPESAGSRPGPVCYGQGADAPDPDRRQRRARPHQRRAPDRRRAGPARRRGGQSGDRSDMSATPLGLDAVDAAEAQSSGSPMRGWPGAIRLVSIERGHDPGRFAHHAVRRRRRTARGRADRRGRAVACNRAALSRHHQRAGLRDRRSPARSRPDREPELSAVSTRLRSKREWSLPAKRPRRRRGGGRRNRAGRT